MAAEFRKDPSHEESDSKASSDVKQAELSSPTEGTSSEAAKPQRKPLLSRLFNRIGLNTSPVADMALDWIQILIIAGLLAWFVMSFVMVRMRVPTPSMEPTILVGDSFFVDKLTYSLGSNEPDPGDIIVFWHTHQFQRCRENSFLIWQWGEEKPCKERFVKRLIAKGPAEVIIRQGSVFVNGDMLSGPKFNRDYVCNVSESSQAPSDRSPEGCTFQVPGNRWFVLGDNTPNSNDSRFWGSLDRKEFIGEPFFRVWPVGRIGPMNSYFGT